MRRLGEAASDVAGGQQSPKSPTCYGYGAEQGGDERGKSECRGDGCSHPREKLNAGLILLAIQPLIPPAPPPPSPLPTSWPLILFRAPLFRRSFRADKRTALFPVVSVNRGIGGSGYSARRVCPLSLPPPSAPPHPRVLFVSLRRSPSPLRSSLRGVPFRIFFFSYWRRFHKYSMAGVAVPRDCETSGRFRPVPGTFAPLNRIWLKSMFH